MVRKRQGKWGTGRTFQPAPSWSLSLGEVGLLARPQWVSASPSDQGLRALKSHGVAVVGTCQRAQSLSWRHPLDIMSVVCSLRRDQGVPKKERREGLRHTGAPVDPQ